MIRLFKVSVPASIIALIISDTVLLFSCYIVGVFLMTEAPDVYLLDENGMWAVSFVVLTVLMGMYFADLYDDYRITSRIELIQRFCMVLGSSFLLQALFNYSRSTLLVLPKYSMVYGSAFSIVSLTAWRIVFSGAVSRAMGGRKLLFLGSSEAVAEMIRAIGEKPQLGLRPLGFLDSGPRAVDKLSGSPRLGTIGDLASVVAEQRPDSIVVGLTDRRGHLPVQRLLELRLSGIHVEDAAVTYQSIFHRVSTRDLRPSELIFSAELGPNRQKLALQSGYSLLIGLVGIVVALPLMAIVAILVRITSRGPVLFRQTRVGFNGRLFTLYKFRSMWQNAEAKTGPIWAAKDDPRVTPLGRWLRKLRLDELPQLFNVLKGEMSVVGPRPERPEFVTVLEEKIPFYRLRHFVKPGITGWAQINYRYSDTIEDSIIKLEYDLYYIKNLAWSLDAYIMFHTAKTMIFGRGSQ
ncbi:MAG TPA: sugar transferase [Bryobacteraceae bacterium]|nr:sugar transferase [Bryobacteraceae bacterium]